MRHAVLERDLDGETYSEANNRFLKNSVSMQMSPDCGGGEKGYGIYVEFNWYKNNSPSVSVKRTSSASSFSFLIYDPPVKTIDEIFQANAGDSAILIA